MDIRAGAALDLDDVMALYAAVGWTAYTAEPETLRRALTGSHLVLSTRRDGRLVGLVRTASDGETICYVQDLLVHPDHQRHGIGRALVAEALRRYEHCRQFVLITDAEDPRAHAFYRSVGLVPGDESRTTVFLRAGS